MRRAPPRRARRPAERASTRPRPRGDPGPRPRLALAALIAAGALSLAPAPAAAQVLQGRVVDDEDERPVAYALIQLLDREEKVRAVATADTAGRYRLEAPEAGEYTILAERIGYDPFRSLLFALGEREAPYPVDIGLRRVPMPIAGITVTAERTERIERAVRLAIGLHPASLRRAPILRPEIETHLERGRNLTGLVRWSNLPGMSVQEGGGGPCFALMRKARRICLPVYLNGFRLPTWTVGPLPLENVEAIVVIYPLESIQYGGGAILLYTAGFIR